MVAKTVTEQNRQILGISLDPSMAKEFKAEAAKLGMSGKALFEDMWAIYKKQPKAKK